MKVAVIGAGALGTLIAGLLGLAAEEDDQIFLIGRPETNWPENIIIEPSEAAQKQLVLFRQGRRAVNNVKLVDNPALATGCELAIILVKSYRSEEAGRQAAALLAPNGVVLSLQNGLGNLEALGKAPGLAGHSVAQGVTTIGALLEKPGVVRFNGVGQTSLPLVAPPGEAILEWFKGKLQSLGLAVRVSPEVESMIWGKLVINCAGNAVTAILDMANEALMVNPPAWEVIMEAGKEVAELARLKGIHLPYPYEETTNQIRQVIEINRATASSMVQSVRRGRPTEIEALNGAVVAEAEKLGFPMPVNKLLTQLVRAIEAKRAWANQQADETAT